MNSFRSQIRTTSPNTRLKFYVGLYTFVTLLILWNQRQTNETLQTELILMKQTIKESNSLFPFASLPGSSPVHSSQFKVNTSLPFNRMIGIPILPVNETNHIVFPPQVKRVWFDVGAHKEAMYTYKFLKIQPDLAVIAFEPMFDMWGQLFMLKHHERMYPIPAAVSLNDGMVSFRRAATDMCSSIKGIDPASNATKHKWPGGCTGTAFEVKVPTLRLETIIDALPFETVEFIKVDAQGADFDVMQSAGKHLRRIKAFVVEVQTEALYSETHTEAEFKEYFERRGFELVKKELQNKHEENLLFRNTLYPLSDDIPISEFFKD